MADVDKPKTAREEAAAIERAKRDAEVEEMRRLRNGSSSSSGPSAQLTAAEAARKKREDEIEQLRQLRAGVADETRQKLDEKGGPLATDMDAWMSNQNAAKNADRRNKLDAERNLHGHGATGVDAWRTDQLGAKDRDRQGRLDAQKNLHGHRGYWEGKTKADLDKDSRRNTSDMGHLSVGDDYVADGEAEGLEEYQEGEKVEGKEKKLPGKLKPNVMFKETDEQIPTPTNDFSGVERSVSFKETESVPEPAPEPKVKPEPEPKFVPTSEPEPKVDSEPEPVVEEEEIVEIITLTPPTYARVDIKFSFGLIVRSSAAEGIVGGENLRENETLRKCMEGTSKILQDQLPLPPDVADLEKRATPSSFRGMFPEAYYNPNFEPTVISIEEDNSKKDGDDDDGKASTKGGNKRTLVKASFPVFLREEEESEAGKKLYSRILKETKSTVFKSLRAAVSGGSFLSLR